jgi:hypothetical protein
MSRPPIASLDAGTLLESGEIAVSPQMPHIPQAPTKTAKPWQPVQRPPVALLTVCDDGDSEGEVIRLRKSPFVIGRTEGDLTFPLDALISPRHVIIDYGEKDDRPRWIVTDAVQAGMFVRVRRVNLADGGEFIVGRGRYQFRQTSGGSEATLVEVLEFAGRASDGLDRPPKSSQARPANKLGPPIPLSERDCWIGRAPGCQVSRPGDACCEPWHARFTRCPDGQWTVEHNKTLNGLWTRVPQVVVTDAAQFQIGEQRFKLKVR